MSRKANLIQFQLINNVTINKSKNMLYLKFNLKPGDYTIVYPNICLDCGTTPTKFETHKINSKETMSCFGQGNGWTFTEAHYKIYSQAPLCEKCFSKSKIAVTRNTVFSLILSIFTFAVIGLAFYLKVKETLNVFVIIDLRVFE